MRKEQSQRFNPVFSQVFRLRLFVVHYKLKELHDMKNHGLVSIEKRKNAALEAKKMIWETLECGSQVGMSQWAG